MIWHRSGEVGMVSEPYRVGKFFTDDGAGCTIYVLHCNDERLGHFNSFEECQEAAEKHQGSQQVVEGRT